MDGWMNSWQNESTNKNGTIEKGKSPTNQPTNQPNKQTRKDILISTSSHCVSWSTQQSPEESIAGIHSIRFSSTSHSFSFQTILQHHLRQRYVVRIIRRAIRFEVNLIQIRKNPADRDDPSVIYDRTIRQHAIISYSLKRTAAEITVFTISRKTEAEIQLSLMCLTM